MANLGKDFTPAEENTTGFVDILVVFWHFRRLVAGITLGVTVVVAVYVYIAGWLPPENSYMPDMYTGKAVLLVGSQGQSGGLGALLANSQLSGLAGIAGVSVGAPSTGEVALIIGKSNSVVDSVVEKFSLAEVFQVAPTKKTSLREKFSSLCTIVFSPASGTLTVTFTAANPQLACDVVNCLVLLLEDKFEALTGNLNSIRKAQLQKKVADVRAEISLLENKIQAFQQKYGALTMDSVAAEQVTTVAQVRAQLMMKELEIKTYGETAGSDNVGLVKLRAERDNVAALLNELENGFSQYQPVIPSQKELPRMVIEFTHIKRDLEVQVKVLELLTQQLELLKIQSDGSDPVLQVLDSAEVPDTSSGPSRGFLCLVAMLASFFGTLLFVALWSGARSLLKDRTFVARFRGQLNRVADPR